MKTLNLLYLHLKVLLQYCKFLNPKFLDVFFSSHIRTWGDRFISYKLLISMEFMSWNWQKGLHCGHFSERQAKHLHVELASPRQWTFQLWEPAHRTARLAQISHQNEHRPSEGVLLRSYIFYNERPSVLFKYSVINHTAWYRPSSWRQLDLDSVDVALYRPIPPLLRSSSALLSSFHRFIICHLVINSYIGHNLKMLRRLFSSVRSSNWQI